MYVNSSTNQIINSLANQLIGSLTHQLIGKSTNQIINSLANQLIGSLTHQLIGKSTNQLITSFPQDRIQLLIVIHLHLLVYLHIFSPCGDVVQELVKGKREVFSLLKEYLELLSALGYMFSGGISAFGFLLHMVDL